MRIEKTSIEGLLEIDLVLNVDERGCFKESFQKEKLEALGFPEFHPVQNNIVSNKETGILRGIHAEPWNKYISLASGKVFVAIVELRPDAVNFGAVETFELSPNKALFVPKGCGNSYQTLEDNVIYTYLVDDHWSSSAKYVSIFPFDEELSINWAIPRERTILSEKDKNNPSFLEVKTFAAS